MTGMRITDGLNCREHFVEYKGWNRIANEEVMLVRMNNPVDDGWIISRFEALKECNCDSLVRYVDLVKKNNELWVIIASMFDRIDRNGMECV